MEEAPDQCLLKLSRLQPDIFTVLYLRHIKTHFVRSYQFVNAILHAERVQDIIHKVQSLPPLPHTKLLAPVSSAWLIMKVTSATLVIGDRWTRKLLSHKHLYFYGPKITQLCMVYLFSCFSSKRHATILHLYIRHKQLQEHPHFIIS